MSKSGHHSRNGFLTGRGYAEAAQRFAARSREVDAMAPKRYLDSRVSVSGLDEDEDLYMHVTESLVDQQYRRFLNGV